MIEGEDGRVVQLRQQVGFLRSSDRLVGSKVAQRNLLQHLPEGETVQRSEVKHVSCWCALLFLPKPNGFRTLNSDEGQCPLVIIKETVVSRTLTNSISLNSSVQRKI